jgi:sugar O-acyltransferase (sialic acid O-acetyltransferase NeuD family)
MRRLALLGASGHGKVVADAAISSGWEMVDFFDDAWPERKSNGIWQVQGDSFGLVQHLKDYDGVLVSIGDCQVRQAKCEMLLKAGAVFATVIHPTATVSKYALVGKGTVVLAGAVVNVDAVLGQFCIVNTGATVDHDCRVGDAVHICPGAHLSGGVLVDACSWIGIGAVIKQRVTIGTRVMVGAGAVVIKSIPDSFTVVGNPATPLFTIETQTNAEDSND